MTKISINKENLDSTGSSLTDLVSSFDTEISNFKNAVNNIPNGWNGQDATIFIEKANAYILELIAVRNAIGEYSKRFCNKPADLKATSNKYASLAGGA